MPLFEYECRDCGKPFEMFVSAERAPECPACHGSNLAKLLSSPGMVGAAAPSRSQAAPAAPMCRAQGGRCGCS